MRKSKSGQKESPAISIPMLHVLISLADGEKHGYAIIKEVRRRTDEKVELSPGTLYPVIKRLLVSGMIAESSERPDPSLDDERRRYYRLTDQGRETAILETERLEEVVAMARSKKLMRPEPT